MECEIRLRSTPCIFCTAEEVPHYTAELHIDIIDSDAKYKNDDAVIM